MSLYISFVQNGAGIEMTNDNITEEQISTFNHAFHTLWFEIMTSRPEFRARDFKGLTFTDIYVISIAYEEPDTILKDIRERLKIPQTTLSSIVGKLEKKGYIHRVINPRDYRSFSLKVTSRGREMMKAHNKLDYEQSRHILGILDEEERREFIRLFTKVAGRLSF